MLTAETLRRQIFSQCAKHIIPACIDTHLSVRECDAAVNVPKVHHGLLP